MYLDPLVGSCSSIHVEATTMQTKCFHLKVTPHFKPIVWRAN